MKIGMVIRGVYPQQVGGQEIQASKLICKLLMSKYSMFVISNTFTPSIISRNKEFHFYRMPILKVGGFRFISKVILNFLSLFLINRRYQLDLIHSHGAIAEGLSSIIFSKFFKIKNVITIHGGGVTDFGKRFPKIVRFILKNSDYIIVTNEFLKKLVIKNVGSDKKITIIPNSIVSSFFKPINKENLLEREFKKYKRNFILLTVARLVYIKNITFLIDLVNDLRNLIPNLKLIIIGEGKLKKSLIKQTKKLGLSSYINFIGKVSQINLPKYYNLADVFISSSIMEGQGLTILEAMACGCLVVANDVGGIFHSIQDGINGFLIKKNDKKGFLDIILKIYNKQIEINKIKKKARNTILQNFDSNENFKKLSVIYEKII
ncbi:MAG: glycosyltransferase family 4 protein [Candidatus Helarchaeota archaeon]